MRPWSFVCLVDLFANPQITENPYHCADNLSPPEYPHNIFIEKSPELQWHLKSQKSQYPCSYWRIFLQSHKQKVARLQHTHFRSYTRLTFLRLPAILLLGQRYRSSVAYKTAFKSFDRSLCRLLRASIINREITSWEAKPSSFFNYFKKDEAFDR